MQSILDLPRHADPVGVVEPPARPIVLDVRSPVLQLALEHLTGQAGYERVSNTASGAPLVTDRVPRPSESADVLVSEATPLAARMAIGAMVLGVVGAIVSGDDPQRLVTALDMVESGHALMPTAVVQAAWRLPNLSARHHHEMACVAAGILHDGPIAEQLDVSAATAKRDVQQLLRMMGVTARRQLGDVARVLGYREPLSEWEVSLVMAASVKTADGQVTASTGEPSMPSVRYLFLSDTRHRPERRTGQL